jgi:pimeloyl-ACP methyl ester carboxylesterase
MEGTLLKTRSADGTEIAYETDGSGPPLLLVGGALNSRQSSADFVPHLADRFTVVRYDRRGRGDSGDTQPYAPEREVEDLQALADAVGGPVYAFGHSSGAALVLLLAASGGSVARMALYEPPFFVDDSRPPLPADHLERFRRGGPEDWLEHFLTEAVELPPAALEQTKASPMWAGMLPVAHTLLYDNTLMWPYEQRQPLPQEWREQVGAVPTLVMDGGLSAQWMRNAARATATLLENARYMTIEDCAHGVPPERLAPVLSDFFGEED